MTILLSCGQDVIVLVAVNPMITQYQIFMGILEQFIIDCKIDYICGFVFYNQFIHSVGQNQLVTN